MTFVSRNDLDDQTDEKFELRRASFKPKGLQFAEPAFDGDLPDRLATAQVMLAVVQQRGDRCRQAGSPVPDQRQENYACRANASQVGRQWTCRRKSAGRGSSKSALTMVHDFFHHVVFACIP